MENRRMKHCGICQKKFKTAKELADHIKECKYVKVGIFLIDKWDNEIKEETEEK